MAGEEFVILLGQEDDESPQGVATEVPGESSAAASKNPEEFVILLGESEDQTESDKTSMPLPAVATIESVNSFYQQLAEQYAELDSVHLDGSGVEQFDTAFAQVLVALQKKCQAEHKGYSLTDPSDVLRANSRRLGLAAAIGLSAGAAGNGG